MSVSFLTVPEKRLSESILATTTSFKVSNIKGWDGENLEAADFGTTHYVAFRNSTNTEMELMEIDPSTIASGSITITRRGLEFDGDLTTEVAANKKLWVKGDTIVSFGTNPPQLYQYLKEYIDGIAISGSPNASTTAKGIVEEATQVELRDRTAAGSTAARLVVNPSTLPNVLIQDYVIDTGTADAYAIAPTPAIVAYVTGQRFSFKATNDNTGASTLAVNGLASPKTIKKADGATDLDAGDIQNGQIVEVEYDGTNFQLMSPVGHDLATTIELNTLRTDAIRFGGTGADGALSASSGATNIDLGSAPVVVKNYTSISLTGTATLTFTNPHANGTIIILKSQGDVTITSSGSPAIDLRSIGAASPAVGSSGARGTSLGARINGGTAGLNGATSPAQAGGVTDNETNITTVLTKVLFLGAGASGGSGQNQAGAEGTTGGGGGASFINNGASGGTGGTGGGAGNGGVGGSGGGGLLIECGGALNITSTINASGGAGGNATGGGSGGGGGGAGVIIILYRTLTANSGTYTVTGGAAGTGRSPGAGAAGYSLVAANTEFA